MIDTFLFICQFFIFFYILISQNVQKLNHQNVNVCIFSTFWKKSIVTSSIDKNISFVYNAKIIFVCFRVSTTTGKLIIIHYRIYLKQAANCPYCHSYFIGNYQLSIVPKSGQKKCVSIIGKAVPRHAVNKGKMSQFPDLFARCCQCFIVAI